MRTYHVPTHVWRHKLLGVHACRSLEGTYISVWIMMETMSVVSVPIKLPEREVYTLLSASPHFSAVSAGCPWWCHWWSSACQMWCASFRHSPPWILCSAENCADPQKLASSLRPWLHCLMYLPAFQGFLYVFFCPLVPPPPLHLTSEYYHFWGTASAFEMLYVQRVNTSVMCHLQSDHPGPIHYRLPGRILQWTGFLLCSQRWQRWRHSPFLRSDHSLPPELFRALLKQCLLNEDAQANLNMKLPLPKIPRPLPIAIVLYTSFLDSYTFIHYLSLSVT